MFTLINICIYIKKTTTTTTTIRKEINNNKKNSITKCHEIKIAES